MQITSDDLIIILKMIKFNEKRIKGPDAQTYLLRSISQIVSYATYDDGTDMHKTFTMTSGHVDHCVTYDCEEDLVCQFRDTLK